MIRKKISSSILWVALLLLANPLFAYSPFVKNYGVREYGAAGQNWAIVQGADKKIYVGNHYGLLEADGYNWNLYALDEKGPVRSIYIHPNGRIYMGLDQGFGYYQRNHYGKLEYTSLSKDLDESILINRQVWSIQPLGDQIIFQTFTGYFRLNIHTGKIDFIHTDESLQLIQNVNGKKFTPTENKILEIVGDSLVLRGKLPIAKARINGLVAYGAEGEMLAFTESNGVWLFSGTQFQKWQSEIDDDLKWAIPNRIMLTKDSLILVGTTLNGLYALHMDGTLAWHINNQNGLQNNTVLGITTDEEENIWLALDNGISVVYNTRFLKVKKWKNKDVGSIYDAEIIGNQIYLATNQGLFRVSETRTIHGSLNPEVELVPGTEGYILDLYKTSDHKLMIGHSLRTLLLDKDGTMTTLSNTGGAMTFKSTYIHGEEHVFHASYRTIDIYTKKNNTWQLKNKVDNFNSSIQFFEIGDNEVVWATHIVKGLYKLQLDREHKTVLSHNFYPVLSPNSKATKIGVFKINNRIVFTDGIQCYTYNSLEDKIVPYHLINSNLEHFKTAHRIVEVDRDNYWFITGDDAALVNFEGEKPQIVSTIYYKDYDFGMLDDFENIVPISLSESVLCYNNGLAKLYPQSGKTISNTADLNISFAEAYNREVNGNRILLPLHAEKRISLPYSHNNLIFKVSLPFFQTKYRFRYFMRGLKEDSILKNQASIDYTRLPYGSYTLEVEAIDRKGDVVKKTSYPFVIEPPFYASTWAYLLYMLLILFVIWLIYQISKRRLLMRHKKDRQKQEKEIIKLENEKLQGENSFKSKELASYAMSMIRQNEILGTLKNELKDQKEKLGTQYPNKYYDRLMNIIDVNISSEQEWEVFQTNFDRIHENFFRNLRKRYPDLSSSDLKLCAYLRLNLESKEIANLMNITIRAIETRRYRMRRKLKLEPNESLGAFLTDFK